MNILLVDDDTLVQKSLDRVLKMNGYEVDIANDGKTAIEKSETKNYDVVLCDIRMPRMNGIETLEKINGRAGKRLLMTGFADEYQPDIKFPCLFKPFGVNELLEYINKGE